jgi:hypothetical protein
MRFRRLDDRSPDEDAESRGESNCPRGEVAESRGESNESHNEAVESRGKTRLFRGATHEAHNEVEEAHNETRWFCGATAEFRYAPIEFRYAPIEFRYAPVEFRYAPLQADGVFMQRRGFLSHLRHEPHQCLKLAVESDDVKGRAGSVSVGSRCRDGGMRNVEGRFLVWPCPGQGEGRCYSRIARSIRANVFSFPRNSRLLKIGGEIVPPLTATRIGWATLPRPNPFASA